MRMTARIGSWWESQCGLLRTIMMLAWPAMLEEALVTVVAYVDSAMVGQLGANASAAVGLTNPVAWLINSPMNALGVGFLACIAKAVGAGDKQKVRTAAMQAMYAVVVVGLLVGCITLSISPVLPKWLNASAEIQGDAAAYFAIVCAPMLFRASIIIFGACLRASGDTKTPMRVSLSMNLVNVAMNFFLIFPSRTVQVGGWSIPVVGANLGVRGAAVASAISYVLGGVLMFCLFLRSKKLSPVGMKLRVDKPVLAECIRVGVPVMGTRIGVCLGHVVFLAQVSSLGTIPLAAHSLALTAEEAVYLPGYGMQAAAATLAGNAVGEKNEKKLMAVAYLITAIATLLMTLTGGFMFFFAAQMLGIFTTVAEVIAAGTVVLRIIAVTEPIYAIGIILEGVFNGVGDTKVPFWVGVGCMWGIRIFLTWICVNFLHLGLVAVWCCMAADNIARTVLLGARFLRGTWKQKLNFA